MCIFILEIEWVKVMLYSWWPCYSHFDMLSDTNYTLWTFKFYGTVVFIDQATSEEIYFHRIFPVKLAETICKSCAWINILENPWVFYSRKYSDVMEWYCFIISCTIHLCIFMKLHHGIITCNLRIFLWCSYF